MLNEHRPPATPDNEHEETPQVHIDDATVYPTEDAAAATLPVERSTAPYPMRALCPLCGWGARGVHTAIAVRQPGVRLVKAHAPTQDPGLPFGGHPVRAVEFTATVVAWTADFEPCGCLWDAAAPGAHDLHLYLEPVNALHASGQPWRPVVCRAQLEPRAYVEAMLELRVGPGEQDPLLER